MASLVSADYNNNRNGSDKESNKQQSDKKKSRDTIVGHETISELKNLFGISNLSSQNKNNSGKDFAVLLGQASAGKVLRGDDFLHLLSGYVQANLSDLRSGMLRLSLNTPCLSYLTSLVKKSRKKTNNRKTYDGNNNNNNNNNANADQVVSQNRRIVLKLAVMLMDLLHLKILSPRKINDRKSASAPLRVKCDVKMFANLHMLEIHGAELYDLEDLSFLRDRLEILYIEGSTVHCPGAILFEPGKVPNPPRNVQRPTPVHMREYHDSKYVWPRLARVKCSNCQMKMLDRSLAFLPKGRVYDFSYNELDTSSFKALALIAQSSLMTSVDLAFNRLSSCGALLSYLPSPSARKKLQTPLQLNLQSLSLRHNRISTTAGLEVLTKLQLLDLSHNLLSSLNEILKLQTLEELRSFSLEGNPIALHPRYRDEIGGIFANTRASLADNKFSLDGKRVRFKQQNMIMSSSSTNGNGDGKRYASDMKSGMGGKGNNGKGRHVRRETLGFEAAITEIKNVNTNFDNMAENNDNDNGTTMKKTSSLMRKRDKKKQKKRVATIEDPSALTVPLSPEKKEKKKVKAKHHKKSKKSKKNKLLVAIEDDNDAIDKMNNNLNENNYKNVNNDIDINKDDSYGESLDNAKGRIDSNEERFESNDDGESEKIQYGTDAWDEMEQYKLQLQKKMEQYHRRLEKKREVKGANWLESSPRDKSPYFSQREKMAVAKKSKSRRRPSKKGLSSKTSSSGTKDGSRSKLKSSSSSSRDKKKNNNSSSNSNISHSNADDVESTSGSSTSTKTNSSKSSLATDDKNNKDADDDTNLLFQREYLAERHYQNATNDNSSGGHNDSVMMKNNMNISNPSIKTCILLIEGASFVEVDITGGNICEKLSLDSLSEVSLIHGNRGDTLLRMIFDTNDSMLPVKTPDRNNNKKKQSKTKNQNSRELLYALHQAGTLEELRCLLQARVIYNMCRNGESHGFQQFITMQCLSCEYLFEWDTFENIPFQCTRCKTSNLRTSRASPRRKSSTQRRTSKKDNKKVLVVEEETPKKLPTADTNATADKVSPKIFDSLKWDYFGSKKNAGSDSNNNDENGEKVNGNTANSNSSTEAMFLSKTMKRSEDDIVANSSRNNAQTEQKLSNSKIASPGKNGSSYATASAKLKVEEEDIVEEKHDPLANMKIHSNLELYFRERVFCSKMKRSERVTHLIVTMVAILDPSSRNIATDANTTPSGKKNNKKGKKKKVNIEGNDQECVLILTDESLYIMKTMDDKTLKFKDNPVFFQIAAYKFKALKQIVIGFCGQRLTLKTADGMAFVLLTRNRDKTYAILQRLPNILEIINEDQKMLESLQKNILKDPRANITLFLMLHRRHKDKKRIMPRTLVLTSSGIYLCEEDYANEWEFNGEESDGIIPRIKLERFSTIKDIIKLEPSERPTDFTIVCTEMFGIIPRQRRWRLRVDTRAKKAKVLQELRKLIRENL